MYPSSYSNAGAFNVPYSQCIAHSSSPTFLVPAANQPARQPKPAFDWLVIRHCSISTLLTQPAASPAFCHFTQVLSAVSLNAVTPSRCSLFNHARTHSLLSLSSLSGAYRPPLLPSSFLTQLLLEGTQAPTLKPRTSLTYTPPPHTSSLPPSPIPPDRGRRGSKGLHSLVHFQSQFPSRRNVDPRQPYPTTVTF